MVSICELESVLCLENRPVGAAVAWVGNRTLYSLESESTNCSLKSYHTVPYDPLDRDICPPLDNHPNYSDSFLRLRDASAPRVRRGQAGLSRAPRIQSEVKFILTIVDSRWPRQYWKRIRITMYTCRSRTWAFGK
jgi:hypothetical protein